jgi:lipopolysaccharide transport system ATP-binding protein
MSNIVIKADNVSKLYRLGQVGTGTLSHDLKRWWALARGKEDPYLKIGVENERTSKAVADYAWALKDVSFEIAHGDTVGIIGRNGAGKSTLLKLLSRVTSPTNGSIKIKGRIASLLEVGTGFHPELTGKENIFLNGAILGMTKKEIESKFDEIVEFAGVSMSINTPVTRYSSGMYVRLAFGVAAHLEPEILIVDEVLAVGDAEFQKKCIGKMGDVASAGRTILFVSHNMQAVQSLCNNSIYMKAGRVVEIGPTERIINNYLSKEVKSCLVREWNELDAPGNDQVALLSAKISNRVDPESDVITVNTAFTIEIKFVLRRSMVFNLSLFLYTASGNCIFNLGSGGRHLEAGHHTGTLTVPENLLNDDLYTINLMCVKDTTSKLFAINDLLSFEVVDVNREDAWYGKWPGAIRPTFLSFSID